MTPRPGRDGEPLHWLDDPRNATKIVWVLAAVCVLLFFADAFYQKHSHFEIEELFGFYPVFGFSVYVALILVAKALRVILMRPESYYDADE